MPFSSGPSLRMSAPMKPGCFFPAMALIAALCIALASIASAARMAPVGANAPDYQAYLATGGVDDLCADGDLAHTDHDCPFCRLLSDPDDLTPTPAIWQLDPQESPLRLVALTVHDQLHHSDVFTRGPPCSR